jgi:hypothetical protein
VHLFQCICFSESSSEQAVAIPKAFGMKYKDISADSDAPEINSGLALHLHQTKCMNYSGYMKLKILISITPKLSDSNKVKRRFT